MRDNQCFGIAEDDPDECLDGTCVCARFQFYLNHKEQLDMKAEVTERRDTPGTWAVEIIDDEGDGDCYNTVFYGPRSEERAREYAAFKNALSESE